MHWIDEEKCTKCRLCVENCPVEAIHQKDKKAVPGIDGETCVDCNLCSKLCPVSAISQKASGESVVRGSIMCKSCPVHCVIPLGKTGACLRFLNTGSRPLKRTRPLLVPKMADFDERRRGVALSRPLLTGVGAGTLYPDPKPTPFVAEHRVEDLDVVTCVTEAPLTFSGIKIKIDTDYYIGEEMAKVKRKGQVVGHVTTEEYGSKMLSLGGCNLMTGKSGVIMAKTIVAIANRERVELEIEKGAKMEIQVGTAPTINGILAEKMRPACGSQVGSLSWVFKGVVDELIILDAAITGLMTEHVGAEEVGLPPSGITPVGRKSTPGRYLGEKGNGWGGTIVEKPQDAIKNIDLKVAWPGMRILVTEPNMERMALLEMQEGGKLVEVELTEKVLAVIAGIKKRSEPSRVAALYVGGIGGGVRRSISRDFPLRVSKAVAEGKIVVTSGGAPVFIFPGGGITYMVDVEKVPPKSFTWIPTPCTVAPLEFTMEKKTFDEIGGYPGVMKPLSVILNETEHEEGR
jgi:6-hydroxynicotinate reductase